MDQPLGTMVGNILEVIEAIEALKGNMQDDVKNVVLELGAYILKLDGKGDNIQDNKEKIEQVISNGDAYKKFLQLVENQGGDISYIENTEKFTKAKYKMPVEAVKTGYVQKLNAEDVGKIAMHLGAGRMKKEDNIDYAVGIELLKKVGCHVEQGEIIAYIYAEFKYIFLMLDFKSPYLEYIEQERHEQAMKDSELTDKEWEDPDFRAACRKYMEIGL